MRHPAKSNVAGPSAARSRYQRPRAPTHERTKTSLLGYDDPDHDRALRVLSGPDPQFLHIAQLPQRVRIEIRHPVISRTVARPHLTKGRLRRVLDDWCPPYSGYHLYYPSRRQPTPAFSLLVDALRYRVPRPALCDLKLI
jgi:hypothetical protein